MQARGTRKHWPRKTGQKVLTCPVLRALGIKRNVHGRANKQTT